MTEKNEYIPDNPPGYIFVSNYDGNQHELETRMNAAKFINVSVDDIIVLRFKNMWAAFVTDEHNSKVQEKIERLEMLMRLFDDR